MLDPEYILRLSEGAEDIAEELHVEIVKAIVQRIVLRLNRGDNYLLTAQDKWQLDVLQDAGYLMEDIQKEIAAKTRLQYSEIKSAFEDAGVKAVDYDNRIYRQAGLSPTPLVESPYLIRLMQRAYEATGQEWVNFTRTTADAAQRLFIEQCDRAYNLVASGAMGLGQAVKQAVENVSRDGVTVTYRDDKGNVTRRDTVETATMRAVRTGVSQACADITDARLKEMDWDIVLTSAHIGARYGDGGENYTNHYWWQGKFYSMSGKDPRFPPFSVCGIGNVQGIHGANCRHSHGAGDGENNPFEHFDSEENRKAYDLSQQQRKMERNIRKTKREAMALNSAMKVADGDAKKELELAYQKKAASLQKQNKAYKEFCEQNNLKTRQDRVSIAKWDRAQAARARGAARTEMNYEANRQELLKEISAGNLSTTISQQKQAKHIPGTMEYVRYYNQRLENGKTPQSFLTISAAQAQELVNLYHGTGNVERILNNGKATFNEYVLSPYIVGKYYGENGYWNTRAFQIKYSRKGTHVFPIPPTAKGGKNG